MSYDDNNHHKSALGSLLSLIINLVIWYYVIKITIKLLVFICETLAKFSIFLFNLLYEVSKFLYITTRDYLNERKKNKIENDDSSSQSISSSTVLSRSTLDSKNSTYPLQLKNNLTERNSKGFVFDNNTSDFRAKYPFVMVDVPPLLRDQFIKECERLQSRIGAFPSEYEQISILESLSKD